MLNQEFDEDDFCSDIFDKYCNRPIQLEILCLHQFASCWKVKAKKIYNYDDENEYENLDEEIELESFKMKLFLILFF